MVKQLNHSFSGWAGARVRRLVGVLLLAGLSLGGGLAAWAAGPPQPAPIPRLVR
ncbi:hypothetical protein [Hymenobacter psoromatis]|uniref:hypothetical protein n=1 Tax=Hymenobacter psoromatis TaxID=1484116 RepID=UPI001CC077A5|nr:hypothetical protein [Hymenobacter psoromatis]